MQNKITKAKARGLHLLFYYHLALFTLIISYAADRCMSVGNHFVKIHAILTLFDDNVIITRIYYFVNIYGDICLYLI